jgi:hypothetical protein
MNGYAFCLVGGLTCHPCYKLLANGSFIAMRLPGRRCVVLPIAVLLKVNGSLQNDFLTVGLLGGWALAHVIFFVSCCHNTTLLVFEKWHYLPALGLYRS